MMRYQSEHYLTEIGKVSKKVNPTFFTGKTILITGATGLIGSYLIDVLLINPLFDVNVIAVVTSLIKGQTHFAKFAQDKRLTFIEADVTRPFVVSHHVDLLIHGASYTDPKGYAAHPIDTMLINILGLKNMLDIAVEKKARLAFLSSCEIYGQMDSRLIKETDSGYLDSMAVRSAYNEAKRASETLAIAYAHEKELPVVIPRISRTFGPTVKPTDTKALSQFLFRGLAKEPIILKSKGNQRFSYCYVADAVLGILFLLEHGEDRQAYNLTNEEQLSLKEVAQLVADLADVELRIELGDEFNGKGYSKAQNALQDVSKLKQLGWQPHFSIHAGLQSTLLVLKEMTK